MWVLLLYLPYLLILAILIQVNSFCLCKPVRKCYSPRLITFCIQQYNR